MPKEINYVVMLRILNTEAEFYLDKDNPLNVYVEYPLNNGALALEPVESQMFKAFLGRRYRQLTKETRSPDFSELIRIKVEDARYEQSNCVRLHRRLAGSISKGKVVYFLADTGWSTVVASDKGWKLGHSKKLKFLRHAIDDAQVEPKTGGDLMELLRKYVNMNNEDFKLFVVYLVQAFSRSSSHFAAIISSDKGTGKTTLTKLIRLIVDPSKSGVPIMPSNESDLKTLLGNSYVVCFDNTAALSARFSNILCAAITGSKEAKRRLYSDSDQVILDLHNMVVLNGIGIVPYKSDLSERSLLFELQKIEAKNRKTDAQFWADFHRDRPLILGAIFDTLVSAMALLPEVENKGLHRMADANKEMIAIAMALDISQDDFQKLLNDNAKKLQEAYAENNPFVNAVSSYVKLYGSVDAPAAKVYSMLLKSTPGDKKFFPDSSSALSRRLNEEKDALEEAGVLFSKHKKPDANYIRLEKKAQNQKTKSSRAYKTSPVLEEDASIQE